MRLALTLAAALAATLGAARTVRLESVVCNPGARVAVPVTLDDAQGLAVVTLTVAYDPLVLAFAEARPGTLADAFSFDFSVAEETGAVTVVAVAPEDIAERRGGTVAELVFDVRPGSDTLHSALALADVRLEEETMTRDLTLGDPTTPTGGLIRPLAAGGDCETRLGDQPITVAAGTRLRRLTLAAGDALQAGAEPTTVTEALDAASPIRVAPPAGGWAPGRYALLRAPKAATPTWEALPEGYAVKAADEGSLVAYTLEPEEATLLTPEGLTLSAEDQASARALLADHATGAAALRLEGTEEAILVGLDLGIVPACERAGDTVTARFANPALRIVALDPAAGTVRVRVLPAEGATLARQPAEGVLRVLATDDLAQAMKPLEAALDASAYLEPTTPGEATLTLRLEGKRTLFLKVVAGRPQP